MSIHALVLSALPVRLLALRSLHRQILHSLSALSTFPCHLPTTCCMTTKATVYDAPHILWSWANPSCTSPLMQSFPAGIVTRETSGFLVFFQILQEDRTTVLTVISKLPRLQKKIDLVLLYHCSASSPKPFEEKQQDLNPARQPQQRHSRSEWSNEAPNIRPKSCGN